MEIFLKSLDVCYKFQFGFCKEHSTSHALFSITEKIYKAQEEYHEWVLKLCLTGVAALIYWNPNSLRN